MQDRLGGSLDAAPLACQPQLEGRPDVGHDVFEEGSAEGRQVEHVGPAAPEHQVDVHLRAGGQFEHHRVAPHDAGGAEKAAQLRRGPAQGSEWVVGVGEEQLGQARARDRDFAAGQERQKRPGLCASWFRARSSPSRTTRGGPISWIQSSMTRVSRRWVDSE